MSGSIPLRSFLKCRLVSGSLIVTIPREHREAIGLEPGDRVLVETDVETGTVTIIKEADLFKFKADKKGDSK